MKYAHVGSNEHKLLMNRTRRLLTKTKEMKIPMKPDDKEIEASLACRYRNVEIPVEDDINFLEQTIKDYKKPT